MDGSVTPYVRHRGPGKSKASLVWLLTSGEECSAPPITNRDPLGEETNWGTLVWNFNRPSNLFNLLSLSRPELFPLDLD